MDHGIRNLRARHWRDSARHEDPETDLQEKREEGSLSREPPKSFNFRDVATSTSSSHDSPSIAERTDGSESTGAKIDEFAESIATVEDTLSDEDIMLRQLGRRSTPYAYIPRIKTTEDGRVQSEYPQPPGAFPDTQAPEKEAESMKEEVKREKTSYHADDRTCRICFSPESSEEKLISPCKCRGTSKWIHLSCLNEWRTHSQNSKSYYRCDQCHYEYSFRRTDLANLLLSRYTLLLLTCLAFLFAAFVGGFFIKLGLWLMPPEYLLGTSGWTSSFSFFYTPLDAGTDMLTAASALIPSTPRRWQDIFIVDIWHFAQGIVSLGIIGVIGFMGTGGLFSLRTFHPRRARRQGDGLGMAELAFILVIVLGCGKVAHSMWKRVRLMVKQRLADLGERILEVDPDER